MVNTLLRLCDTAQKSITCTRYQSPIQIQHINITRRQIIIIYVMWLWKIIIHWFIHKYMYSWKRLSGHQFYTCSSPQTLASSSYTHFHPHIADMTLHNVHTLCECVLGTNWGSIFNTKILFISSKIYSILIRYRSIRPF